VLVGLGLLLFAGATAWVTDYECFRTSDGTVKRRVGELQRQIAGSDWERACALLVSGLQAQYATVGDGKCSHGLRSAIEQGGAHLAPITSTWVNEDQTYARVTTRHRVYDLAKPENAGCPAWRVESMKRRGR
jgi:hypothetical protein